MSAPASARRYRVRFTVRDCYEIIVQAADANDAISLAEDLYAEKGEAPFSFDISRGGVGGWKATEVAS